MGEARRRAKKMEEVRVIIGRVSLALKRLTNAASEKLGSDCYVHAALGQELLRRVGIESRIVGGTAAFRVGNGDSDVILHDYSPGMIPQLGALAYHIWQELDHDYILDLSTHTIPVKCAALDALDGGYTTVLWAPDFLLAHKSEISSMRDVTQLHAGVYFYSRNEEIENIVLKNAPTLDDVDVNTAWLLFKNPNIQAFGPNDVLRNK